MTDSLYYIPIYFTVDPMIVFVQVDKEAHQWFKEIEKRFSDYGSDYNFKIVKRCFTLETIELISPHINCFFGDIIVRHIDEYDCDYIQKFIEDDDDDYDSYEFFEYIYDGRKAHDDEQD